jgi:hypothetical protein
MADTTLGWLLVEEVVWTVNHVLDEAEFLRIRAHMRAGGGRLLTDPDRVLVARRFPGGSSVIEHDRTAVRRIEHLLTTRVDHNFTIMEQLDFLQEIAETMPLLRFADCWHGYLRFLLR